VSLSGVRLAATGVPLPNLNIDRRTDNVNGLLFAYQQSAMTNKIINRGAAALLAALFCISCGTVRAQTPTQERADALRQQLEELKSKQLDLQSRVQTLDEQLKPENIEKSLAGVGSTKPEDLRELKRTQLETEKQNVQKQLELLLQTQVRIENGLAQADAQVYQESARGPAVAGTLAPANATSAAADNNSDVTNQKRSKRANRKARQRRVTQPE
jgi:peptidoglycan hydrolase CwlO-like protein